MLRSNGNSLWNPWRLSPYHTTSSSLLLQRQAPWHISRACGHWPLSRLSGSRCWLTVLSMRPQPGGSRASIRSPPMTWWSEQLWWSCLGSACATRPKKQVFCPEKILRVWISDTGFLWAGCCSSFQTICYGINYFQQFYLLLFLYVQCLQCSDAVGWAAGRASGL